MVERVPSNLQVLSSFECLGAITAFTHAVERWRAAGLSGIERLDTAIRRGTSVATLSASEGSLLRCATAVSSEARDDRATNPAYLTSPEIHACKDKVMLTEPQALELRVQFKGQFV